MPKSLPDELHVVWEAELGGSGLGGIAANERFVIFGDRDVDDFHDVFRCLDAATGEPVWEHRQLAIGALDYGNSPRATPLIDGQRVFLFGAFGDLHAVRLDDGRSIWKRNVRSEFSVKADMPWGYCGSPLLVDGRLIVNPGGANASLVALDPADGKLIWSTPGEPASYGSLIAGTFGGAKQIVGHDAVSLGGWDPESGRRLWTLTPEVKGDFNVPTPLEVDGKLLVVTENNGARLYQFREDGAIDPKPVMHNRRLTPNMSTPVLVGERLFCVKRMLYCLDVSRNLQERWRIRDRALADYGAVIAGDRRVLVVGKGELLLIDAHDGGGRIVSRLAVFDDGAEIFSHPALVGEKLYIRGASSLKCVALR